MFMGDCVNSLTKGNVGTESGTHVWCAAFFGRTAQPPTFCQTPEPHEQAQSRLATRKPPPHLTEAEAGRRLQTYILLGKSAVKCLGLYMRPLRRPVITCRAATKASPRAPAKIPLWSFAPKPEAWPAFCSTTALTMDGEIQRNSDMDRARLELEAMKLQKPTT